MKDKALHVAFYARINPKATYFSFSEKKKFFLRAVTQITFSSKEAYSGDTYG